MFQDWLILFLFAIVSASSLNCWCGNSPKESKMIHGQGYSETYKKYKNVQGMFLYVAAGGKDVIGGFPYLEKGALGPADLDRLVVALYAQNGNVNLQKQLGIELKEEGHKGNSWAILRSSFWLKKSGEKEDHVGLDESSVVSLQKLPSITTILNPRVWKSSELSEIENWGKVALLGDSSAAWKLYTFFSNVGKAKTAMRQNNLRYSVLEQTSILWRSPFGLGREGMAEFWLLVAAENGHLDAQHELGTRWSIPDYFATARSMFWLRKAADGGHEKAKKWLEQLEQTNHPKFIRKMIEEWQRDSISPS